MKITDEQLGMLRQLRDRQDKHAEMIGVATFEWRQQLDQLCKAVNATRLEQLKLGDSILRSYGLNPAEKNFTIDMETGEIKELIVKHGGSAEYISITS